MTVLGLCVYSPLIVKVAEKSHIRAVSCLDHLAVLYCTQMIHCLSIATCTSQKQSCVVYIKSPLVLGP